MACGCKKKKAAKVANRTPSRRVVPKSSSRRVISNKRKR